MSENPRGVKADALQMLKKFKKQLAQHPGVANINQLQDPFQYFFHFQNQASNPAPNAPSFPPHPASSQDFQMSNASIANHPQNYPHQSAQNPGNNNPSHIANAAFYGPTATPASVPTSVFPTEMIEQILTRPYSACVKFGQEAVREACKGLSRVITPGDDNDLQLFGTQLMRVDSAAIAEQYESCIQDRIPCFATSYVQVGQDQVVGRFKFSRRNWENLHYALRELRKAGVQRCRLWLDQCLWIRDASMGSWAHTGLLPYVLWPVISLSDRIPRKDRSELTVRRMWPFVEEVSGLWSLGVIMTSEYRTADCKEGDVRRWMSFNLRVKLEPEDSLELLLKNIYHGAADSLETGWTEDVEELKDMARWNLGCPASVPIVGPGWRERIATLAVHSRRGLIRSLHLPKREVIGRRTRGVSMWLDGSRKCARSSWDGLEEWTSGNSHPVPHDQTDLSIVSALSESYNCVSDKGEFQIIHVGDSSEGLSLLVAMDGRSSGITRGKVAWTKVLSGSYSCQLPIHDWESGNLGLVSQVLAEQLGEVTVQIYSFTSFSGTPEWV